MRVAKALLVLPAIVAPLAWTACSEEKSTANPTAGDAGPDASREAGAGGGGGPSCAIVAVGEGTACGDKGGCASGCCVVGPGTLECATGTTCPNGGTNLFACDNGADCPIDQVCCADLQTDGPPPATSTCPSAVNALGSRCVGDGGCGPSQRQLCTNGTECGEEIACEAIELHTNGTTVVRGVCKL